jgi:hypothetical protein
MRMGCVYDGSTDGRTNGLIAGEHLWPYLEGLAWSDLTTTVAYLKNPFIFAFSSDVFLKESIAN